MLSQITYTYNNTYTTFSLYLSIYISMAMMMEVEDDVFFADLNRQISLLITDDDEDGDEAYYSHPISSYPTSVSIQGISRASRFPTAQTQYHIDHFDQMYNKTSSTTTTIDQSKGTGVFIPKSSSSSSQWNRSRRSSKPTRNPTNYNNYYNSYNNTNNFRHHQQQPQQLQSQTVVSQVTTGSKKW